MMNSFFDKMGEKLMPFASKVSANRYLNAIKEGFFGVMQLLLLVPYSCFLQVFLLMVIVNL